MVEAYPFRFFFFLSFVHRQSNHKYNVHQIWVCKSMNTNPKKVLARDLIKVTKSKKICAWYIDRSNLHKVQSTWRARACRKEHELLFPCPRLALHRKVIGMLPTCYCACRVVYGATHACPHCRDSQDFVPNDSYITTDAMLSKLIGSRLRQFLRLWLVGELRCPITVYRTENQTSVNTFQLLSLLIIKSSSRIANPAVDIWGQLM